MAEIDYKFTVWNKYWSPAQRGQMHAVIVQHLQDLGCAHGGISVVNFELNGIHSYSEITVATPDKPILVTHDNIETIVRQ